jgi:hypothetical protein
MPPLSKAASAATSTVVDFLIRRSVSHLTGTNFGAEASKTLMNTLLSMPMHAFNSIAATALSTATHSQQPQQQHTTASKAMDTIQSLLKHSPHDPAHLQQAAQGLHQQQPLSNHNNNDAPHWALGILSVVVLYLEYLGMRHMKSELPRMQVQVAQGTTGTDPITTKCRQILHGRYRKSTYYTVPNPGIFQTIGPQDTDPVRVVYNLLVGLNTAFFAALGGRSTDSTAEILHWGGLWFYWEVLAQLVHLYGLSPVTIAYKHIYAQLVKELRSPQ